MPRTATPTIAKPITEPALKATRKPLATPFSQATAVRTLASTATDMPSQPASAEHSAPKAKAAAVRSPSPCCSRTPNTKARITPRTMATAIRVL